MIVLNTGLPGHGKTLFTLHSVNVLAVAEGRPVYYFGIEGLTLDWKLLDDPKDWHNCPDGSIIVIDECQKVFPTRSNGSFVPAWISAFETHRHKGHDVFLITQHPTLMDAHVRKLVGRHNHLVREFGFNSATVFELQQCAENIKQFNKGSSTLFVYPKEAFNWYKSATVHTVKARLPKKYLMAIILIPLILATFGLVVYMLLPSKPDVPEVKKSEGSALGLPSIKTAPDKVSPEQARLTYFASHTPRISGFAHTAPVYDGLTDPVEAPYPVGCINDSRVCRCYSQQGTRLNIDNQLCLSILETGFFKDWNPSTERKPSNKINFMGSK